jgi:hypothetical protein
VLLEDAGLVLHRHLPATEGHDARAQGDVGVEERCSFE